MWLFKRLLVLVVGKKHLSWVSTATVQGARFIVFKLLHCGVFSHPRLLLAQSWLCWHPDQPLLAPDPLRASHYPCACFLTQLPLQGSPWRVLHAPA